MEGDSLAVLEVSTSVQLYNEGLGRPKVNSTRNTPPEAYATAVTTYMQKSTFPQPALQVLTVNATSLAWLQQQVEMVKLLSK